jgi:beta-lactamase regulating signal transducer with metallopeptidase domain
MTDWLGRAALVVWAAGAATHVLMLAGAASQTVRLFRRCRRVTGDLVADYGLSTQPGSGVLLLAGPDVPGPLCWQWQRSVIVVPDSLLSFPAEELRAVLRHELAHLRAGHPLQLFLQRLVAALYWFHPAVRWALRRAVRDREFLCDAESVSSREDAAVYLRSLIRLSEQAPDTERQFRRGTALSWGGGHQSLVAERAARLAGGNLATQSIGHSRAASAFLMAMAGLLAVVAWIPVNPRSSPRSHWSPWPATTANVLHTLGIPARDYELDAQIWRPEELRERAR